MQGGCGMAKLYMMRHGQTLFNVLKRKQVVRLSAYRNWY